MGVENLSVDVYQMVKANYAVAYGKLPSGFTHKKLLYGLGPQRTDSSCGQTLGTIALLARGDKVNHRSSKFINWINKCIPTKKTGIDPYPLARGVHKLGGVESVEYRESSVEFLVELLTASQCFCGLLIQAPWAKYKSIKERNAGHNVVAGHYDDNSGLISGFEPGNGNRFFQMPVEVLEDYWQDRAIRSPRIIFNNWLLWMPVLQKEAI